MASTDPGPSRATRNKTNIWRIGYPIETLSTNKLPSEKEVLSLFMYNKDLKKLPTRVAFNSTAQDVIHVWNSIQPDVPTKLQKHVVAKIENSLNEWQRLKKNKGNKKKRSEILLKKEEQWEASLNDLFDIKGSTSTHQSQKRKLNTELDITNNKPVTSSDTDMTDTVTTTDDEFPVPRRVREPKMKMKPVMNDKLAVTLDMAKLSDRGAALVLTPAIQSLGQEASSYACSYSTIRRQRTARRELIAKDIKESFNPQSPLTVHWDGKLLEDLTGHETVDRLPIIVTGKDIEQLLAIPKLTSGTGEATAEAVFNACESWDINDFVRCMCFDTTAANSGVRKGACTLLQQKLQKDLLWLACRHHILEIMLEAVVSSNLPAASSGPEIQLFKRFRSKWTALDKSDFTRASEDMCTTANEIIAFANNQLELFQPRDDYKELLQLTIVFLGGNVKNFTFKAPAGLHRARWMAKAIYSLKIWMFQRQFRLTAREERGLKTICIFTVQIYVNVWFTAGVPSSAPRTDLQLLKDLWSYREINQTVADLALKKMLGHLWYLSEELVAFSFFDAQVTSETKRKMVYALQNTAANKGPPKRPTLDASLIKEKELHHFVTVNTISFFTILGLDHDFLDLDPDQWPDNDNYVSARNIVRSMKVTNDVAERGVALMEQYNTVITNNEQQKQYVLQVVNSYRKRYPDRRKATLSQ